VDKRNVALLGNDGPNGLRSSCGSSLWMRDVFLFRGSIKLPHRIGSNNLGVLKTSAAPGVPRIVRDSGIYTQEFEAVARKSSGDGRDPLSSGS
jgi:hypothetical protein